MSENLLKMKGEDSVKWWSIRGRKVSEDSVKWWSIRGRKVSKDRSKENKNKPPPRPKSRCSN